MDNQNPIDYKSLEYTEDQSRYLDTIPGGDAPYSDKDFYRKAFTLVNRSEDKKKGWEMVRQLTRGSFREEDFESFLGNDQNEQGILSSGEEQPTVEEGAPLFGEEEGYMTASPKRNMPDSIDQLKSTSYMASVVLSDSDDEDEMALSTEEAVSIVAEEGEDPLRNAAIDEDIAAATQNVIEQVNKGEEDEGILSRSVQLARQKREERDLFTLEKAFFNKIENFKESSPEWADLKLYQPSITTKLREEAIKDAVISAKLRRVRVQERGIGYSLSEFADDTGELILTLLGDDIVAQLRSRGLDPTALLYAGEQIRQLPVDQIPAAMDNYYRTLAKKSSLIGTDQDFALKAFEDSFGDTSIVGDSNEALIMDIVFTLPFVGAVKTVTGLMKKAKATKKVAESAAKTITRGDATQTLHSTVEEAVKDSIPMTLSKLSDGVASSVARTLEINDKALKEVMKLPNVSRMTPEEVQQAVNKQVKELEKLHDKTQINRTGLSYNDTKGVYEVEIQIGRRDGAGFSSEASAKSEMTKRGIGGDIVETDSGFMIQQKHPLKESMMDNGFADFPTVGPVGRLLKAPKAYVDRLLGQQGTAASLIEARTVGVLKDLYQSRISNLPKKDLEEISSILNDGIKNDTREWLTTDKLMAAGRQKFGKELTNEQVTAYKSYIQISDAAHFLDNGRIYKEKASKGMLTLELPSSKTGKFEGSVHTDPNALPNIPLMARTFDTTTGQASRMSAGEIKQKVQEGFTLIRPEDPSWTMREFNGEGASFILVKGPKGVKTSPLSYEQLNYVGGGRREHAAPLFIGQLRRGKFKDGTTYLDNPAIFRTANTYKEAEKFIAEAELARMAINAVAKGTDDAARLADELLTKTGKSFQEWKQMSLDEKWNLSEKFRIKRDREDFPISIEEEELMSAARMYNPEASSTQFGVRGKDRLSSRGEWLKDVNHEYSTVYDSMAVLTRNVDSAIKAGVFSDFKISAINRFNTQFRAHIEGAESLTPYELITKGVPTENVKKNERALYNAIKGHQFYIKSILRVRGSWDETVQLGMDKLARQIEKIPLDSAQKMSTNIYKNRGNPMETIRSINFDINLGMLNPQQFLMQANTALIATSMSPRHGMASFKDAIPLRYALIADDYGTTKWLGKKVREATDGGDLAAQADQFKRMGFNDFGNSLSMMDNQVTLGATSNRFMEKLGRAREAGRFFFAEGERYSRLVAYGIARRKYKDAHPNANEYGKGADLWIREETDRLILSPNSDNNALLNKGIGAIPTQFWSYMMKMSDAVLTGSGGRYSAAERARLAGSQVLFYGAGGLPFLDYMLDSYQKSTGEVMDPTLAKALHNGMLDLIPWVASGGEIDTDFSSASGMGRWMSSIMENVTENNMPELLGGPAGSKMHGAWKVAQNTARITGMLREPSPENVTITALATVASLVKSLSASTQAVIAYNTGIWYDRYGRAVAEVSKGEAVMSMFSFNPQAQADVFRIMTDQKNAQKKFVSEVIPQFEYLHTKWNNAETDEERKHIEESINALSVIVQGTGYLGDNAQGFMSYLRSPNFLDSQRNMLNRSIQLGQKGANPNLLGLEQRKDIINNKDK